LDSISNNFAPVPNVDVAQLKRTAQSAQSGEDGAAKKLQAVFTTLLVKEMRKSLPEGFFGSGPQGDIYSGWLDEHVGQALADRDTLHMQEIVGRSLAAKTLARDGVKPQ
jgi:Rod binding domain-containing protein